MKNATIRLIFVLALLSAVGIIVTQVYWVRRAYSLEEKEVNLKIYNALRNVAVKIWELKKTQPLGYNIVDKVAPDYFIVQINENVSPQIIAHLLTVELERHNIITDFEFGVYDCMTGKVTTRKYIHMTGSTESFSPIDAFPQIHKENYYFGVYFPNRDRFLVGQLSVWVFSSIGLLCVLSFMGYVVFVILRQKRLSEVQKDFVNNMTHEFKTPLTSIQLAAESLTHPDIVKKPQRLLSYATIIENEATLLARQVERVLTMAQADKEQIQLHMENFAWQDLIREVIDTFDSQLQKYQAVVSSELPAAPVTFRGNKLHLRNVLSNLLDNALKYTTETPRIMIRLNVRDKDISISVEDNGIGIDKEHQEMLFRKFYRVPTGNLHDVKGFGLGLNYAQIITEAHGGRIFCESKIGQGSKFFLIFPKNT